MKILLLEDDAAMAKEIKLFLENHSYTCDCVNNGSVLLQEFNTFEYDVLILDVNVPGINGILVCDEIRKENKKTAIIMLTAFGEVEDKVEAFKKGADDYLVKPFHFNELLARIISLLRRKEIPQVENDIFTIADLSINNTEMKVFRNGKEINLSPKEYKLLYILSKAKGRVITKQTIAEQLWDDHIQTNQNTIEVYINFLRKKIDNEASIKLIHTKKGYGYYLKDIETD